MKPPRSTLRSIESAIREFALQAAGYQTRKAKIKTTCSRSVVRSWRTSNFARKSATSQRNATNSSMSCSCAFYSSARAQSP